MFLKHGRELALLVLVTLLIASWFAISQRAHNSLVVYCTHDLVYAEPVLEEFTRRTGIAVTIVGDTEATKSLGLVERLLQEGKQTPCDLFWNNEVLGTMRLQQKSLLKTYSGPAAARIPSQFRDTGWQWFGFGGRMRVWVINTTQNEVRMSNPQGISEAGAAVSSFELRSLADSVPVFPLSHDDLSRVAIAKPLYGTTFTQFALLWKGKGAESTQQEHAELLKRGCRIVAGNAMVRDLVAGGSCDLGMTDTDDVFAARDAGHAVDMLPIRLEGKTICIPNTVSILKSSDRPQAATQLLEYLLSEEVELTLAKTARQIPLGTVTPERIPEDVRPLVEWAQESWNVAEAAEVAPACLEWLKSEYAR